MRAVVDEIATPAEGRFAMTEEEEVFAMAGRGKFTRTYVKYEDDSLLDY